MERQAAPGGERALSSCQPAWSGILRSTRQHPAAIKNKNFIQGIILSCTRGLEAMARHFSNFNCTLQKRETLLLRYLTVHDDEGG